jgi:acetyl esterase
VHHVSEKTPPTLIMHGTADTAVHHENSVEFVARVKRRGGHAELVLYPGQRHGFFSPGDAASHRRGADPDTSFELTTREMIRFIRRTVMGES